MQRLWKTTILTIAMVVLAAPAAGADLNGEEMLAEAEMLAREVREGAGIMQTYVRFPTSYSNESHERMLLRIKENTNQMGDIVQKLHKNRGDLETWQAELVNRILPKMDALTTDIDKAIEYIDENPQWDAKPTYEEYVDGTYNQADAIVQSIDRYLEWADVAKELGKMSG